MVPRIGLGYDIHRTETGEQIRLGGLDLQAPFSLRAHSDGDVLIHAVIDALLGALALGDIGTHFPDDDPRFSNVSGTELLERTLPLIEAEGCCIGNLDTTIIAERPKLKEHVSEIRSSLAGIIGCSEKKLSIKATTHEKLGPTGREEGVAVHAVVLLISSDDRPDQYG